VAILVLTYYINSNDVGQKYINNKKRYDCKFSINGIERLHLYRLKVQLCIMELLNFIFRLGVLFAIYGFLWGIFEIGITLLRSGRPKTVFEEYFIKSVKYLFLVDVTFLFCTSSESTFVSEYHLLLASLVLLTYFVGKLQRQQNQMAMFQMMSAMNVKNSRFNIKAEIIVIIASILLFGTLTLYPAYASNAISLWFRTSITDIENTVIIGFIFKIIGFFFLVSMITKMLNAFVYLISGRPFIQASSSFETLKKKKESDFDDYEEVE
jgi:hypothetical protein